MRSFYQLNQIAAPRCPARASEVFWEFQEAQWKWISHKVDPAQLMDARRRLLPTGGCWCDTVGQLSKSNVWRKKNASKIQRLYRIMCRYLSHFSDTSSISTGHELQSVLRDPSPSQDGVAALELLFQHRVDSSGLNGKIDFEKAGLRAETGHHVTCWTCNQIFG